jgi:hypothetical protein
MSLEEIIMFCPKCRSVFEAEIAVCPECEIPLIVEADKSEDTKPSIGEIQPFVLVFETSDPTLLSSATGLLDGANIPFAVRNESASGILPSQVLVPEEYAQDVQELLSRQAEDVDDA